MQNLRKEVGIQETFECKISERELGYRKHLNTKSQIGGQHKISEGVQISEGEGGKVEL